MDEAAFNRWQTSLSNFEWLGGAVPGATDLDCLIHASAFDDKFLLFEFKNAGERIPVGQRMLLNAVRKCDGWTVVTVHGPDKEGFYVLGMDWHGKVDKDGLLTLVKNWWSSAKGGSK